MRDARDAEDALLLQNGDHAALIAAYHEIVVQRCRIAVRSDAGYDVAQNVFERLLKELARGKRYRVPYRVVVHKVVDWTVKEHFQGRPTDAPLPEGWDLADEADPYRPARGRPGSRRPVRRSPGRLPPRARAEVSRGPRDRRDRGASGHDEKRRRRKRYTAAIQG